MLAWLDVHRGVFRYHVCYNMVVLRMISYAVDQHWHRVGRGLARANTADAISPDRLTYKSRTLELQPGARDVLRSGKSCGLTFVWLFTVWLRRFRSPFRARSLDLKR